ncbi:MAG: DUF6671 family protein [Halioglobus sp.]
MSRLSGTADHRSQAEQHCAVALLTRHNKAQLIAPALSRLGWQLTVTDGFDTDQLGTFSGEMERTLTPVACARRKAQIACELTGLRLGLGSEGSFGGGPLPGLLNWDEEILLLWDNWQQREIVASTAGPINLTRFSWESSSRLKQQLASCDPAQAWMICGAGPVIKGLRGYRAIIQQLKQLGATDAHAHGATTITLEPDLRAMHCPERQGYIRKAAKQLVQRLKSLCPQCAAPDFWNAAIVPGLPCSCCHMPTELPRAFIRRCKFCHFEISKPNRLTVAEPGQCQWCNP